MPNQITPLDTKPVQMPSDGLRRTQKYGVLLEPRSASVRTASDFTPVIMTPILLANYITS
jgi:hypothetical protein